MVNTGAGKTGERLAADYLRKKGYSILTVNFRCRFGEIDVIAQNRKYIAFVEVKTRRSERLSTALGDVDRFKQMHLMSAAYAYLSRYNVRPAFRFDVVTIVGEQPPYHLKHYVNVFTPWGIQAWRREHHRPNRK